MKHYWLERHMERSCQKPDWKPHRIQILEELIRETAYFNVDLGTGLVCRPSWFDEEELLHQCLNETYAIQAATSHVFMHLYTSANQQANAIGLLIEKSCWAGWQLWRTLYECHAVCEFLARFCNEHPQVFRDYISHTLLSSWIRQRESYNELCKRSGKEPHYDELIIADMRSTYKDKFKSSIQDYGWAQSIFQEKKPGSRIRFAEILEKIGDDMSIFYRRASEEIHPTLGHRFALLTTSLPLSAVPMLPGNGPLSYRVMSLDYLTAKLLREITSRVTDFLDLNEDLRTRWDCLSKLGDDVLDKLTE